MISYALATVPAASPPFKLQALALRRVYENRRGLSASGDSPFAGLVAQDVRREAGREMWEWWLPSTHRRAGPWPSGRYNDPAKLGGLEGPWMASG